MKPYETSSCGYALKFNGPDSVEAYDAKAGPGACLRDACQKTIYAETLPDWQEAFALVLQARTGIPRQVDQEATSRAKARSKHPETVTPINERVTAYNERVKAEWADGDETKRGQLREWAQETADKIELTPAAVATSGIKFPSVTKADLLKANEILSHDPNHIEERISMMLSDIPDYELVRDAQGKPEPQSLARLINAWITQKLKLFN